MKTLLFSDTSLTESTSEQMNFKQKVELCKQLDKLNIDIIELNGIKDEKTDVILYKTIASAVKNCTLCVPSGLTAEKIETAYSAIKDAKKTRINVIVPVSAVQMEYVCVRKPDKVLLLITELVSTAAKLCPDVEFTAEDASRSESDFLISAVAAAINAGAKTITLCDTAGICLPDEITRMLETAKKAEGAEKCVIGIKAADTLDMATANMFAAVKAGAGLIKTSVNGVAAVSIESAANAVGIKGSETAVRIPLDTTKLKKTVEQLKRFNTAFAIQTEEKTAETVSEPGLNENSGTAEVKKAVKKLGYDLSEEDYKKVYEAFLHIAKSKDVGTKELEVIIATEALQGKQTYKLISYVINSGNIIGSTANIALEKNGERLNGLFAGDGPIDASFMAIEKIVGHHFELDDFQINAVTEGREAMGEAIVKLRHKGMLFSGRGISTDIIGASIRAYLSALNKIENEEQQ